MILGGFALLSRGYQQYSEAPLKGQYWLNNQMEPTRYNTCTSNMRFYTEEGCRTQIAQAIKSNWHEKNARVETWQNEGTGKMVGGFILALFAFLIMWGGNRSRRPKEVRIRRD
jgi:hypothetical protein